MIKPKKVFMPHSTRASMRRVNTARSGFAVLPEEHDLRQYRIG
jgi:hypothetical protein